MNYVCKESDHVRTPKYLLQFIEMMFGVFWDGCPYKCEWDTFDVEWHPVTYINPPFSNVVPFIKKAYCHWKTGNTVIMLIRNHPSIIASEWWHNYVLGSAQVYCINHRIIFEGYDQPSRFGCFLLVYRGGEKSTEISTLFCLPYGQKDQKNQKE